MTWWFLFVLGWYFSFLWFVSTFKIIRFFKNYQLSKESESFSPLKSYPLVSVIVPARNEEGKIEICLQSLLKTDYSNIEIIAVNDRSEDRTGAIMDRLADGNKRLRVIHIKELPEKWLGKNHAMYKASQTAKGDFLLFTDGDIIFEKETLRLAIQYITHNNLDHICLFPQTIPGSYWENALTVFFGLLFILGTKPWAIPGGSKRAYAGIGAFNLVGKSAYDKIGGAQETSSGGH